MNKRKSQEINSLNYTGAIAVAIKQADREQSSKINIQKWLPYDLGESNILTIGKELAAELVKMRDRNELPPAMLRDLYKNKLISPGDQ